MPSNPRVLQDAARDLVDWEHWIPDEQATLLFVIRDGRVLLIHKKRGLGAGKINGPGGRIEPGESAEQAAVREVREELGIVPRSVRPAGELWFQFLDGAGLQVFVFRADDHDGGPPQETDEAVPLWVDVSRLPYDRMWEDDPHWIPYLLAGRRFRGRFVFHGDRMLAGWVEPEAGTG